MRAVSVHMCVHVDEHPYVCVFVCWGSCVRRKYIQKDTGINTKYIKTLDLPVNLG